MPDYRRRSFCGGYYFFTVVTYNRRPFLTSTSARQLLRESWRRVYADYPFQSIAICLLPDHLHCIWRMPEEDCDYSTRWRLIKTFFSKAWILTESCQPIQSDSRDKKKELPVWHRRFWEHQIRDMRDLEKHCNYIHYNPVKHKFVEEAIQWPWSTYRRFVRDDRFLNLSQENLDWMAKTAKIAE